MKIDLSYVNSIEVYPSEEIATKEHKVFYHQKIVIKGSKELITMILRSSEVLLKPNAKPKENNDKKNDKK